MLSYTASRRARAANNRSDSVLIPSGFAGSEWRNFERERASKARIATLKVERSAAACGSARHEIAARKVPSGKEIADAGRNAGDR